MGSSIVSAVALAALAFLSVAASPPAPLEPSGPWTVEPADAMCIVGRDFGTGDQLVTLGFRPYPLGEKVRIALWIPATGKKFTWGKAELALDEQTPVEEYFDQGPVPIKGKHLIQIDIERSKIETLHAAKLLHIRTEKRNWSFKLGNVAGAMKALQGCENDLLVKWGMDPAVLASIETSAFHPFGLESIFRTSDYPRVAMSRNEQGTAGVRYWIGTNGKVSDCRVVETSGSALLDQQTCDVIIRRARYFPARVKSGESVASIGFQRIRWELP
jgi:TonB family protein